MSRVLMCWVVAWMGVVCSAVALGTRPNILFILVDDLGWADVGYQNPEVSETPRVDRLAEEGVVFQSAYAAAVCSPSRAEILTGRSPASLKLTSHIPGIGFEQYYPRKRQPTHRLWDAAMVDHLPLEEVTIAEALKSAGYATGFFGKWHLGGAGSVYTTNGVVNAAWHPQHQGFDVNVGGCAYGEPSGHGGKAYLSPYANAELPDGPNGEYLTDRLADETIAFMRDCGERPFFAFLGFYSIHLPHVFNPAVAERASTDYGRMLVSMDDAVGRVLDALDRLGLRNDTLVVFTSDNGGTRSQQPLRGAKGTLYEGGIRVPLIIRLPGTTPGGRIVDVPVAAADFFPTLLEVASVPVPSDAKQLDGVSYYGLLTGDVVYEPHPVFQHFPHHRTGTAFQGASTIRLGDWKLKWNHEAESCELYNLGRDLGESENCAADCPEQTDRLKVMLFDWLKKTDANMPRRVE